MAKHGKRPSRKQRQVEQHRQRWLAIGAVVVAVLVLGAAILWPRPRAQPAANDARLSDDPSLGPATAPVTIVEYGDFG